VLPWRARGTPGGSVRPDFVFGECLPVRATAVRPDPLSDTLPYLTLPVIAPEPSPPVRRLLRVVTDGRPPAGGLVDAVPLAEQRTLRHEPLRGALVHNCALSTTASRSPPRLVLHHAPYASQPFSAGRG
jgi:hypothetical protein